MEPVEYGRPEAIILNVIPSSLDSIVDRHKNSGGHGLLVHAENHLVAAAGFEHSLVNQDAGRAAGHAGCLVNLHLKICIFERRGYLRDALESFHELGGLEELRGSAILLPRSLVKHAKGHGWGER